MGLWAKIDGGNKKVSQVIVAEKEYVDTLVGTWIECTDRQPRIDSTYDSAQDKFIPVKPYDSWVYDAEKNIWNPPVARPTDGSPDDRYVWDEENTNWVKYTGN